MISKSELLTILMKYGMDSKYKEPFLYEEKNQVGLVYSFMHPLYGYLHRSIFFDDLKEAEEFVYQYWWYRKYHEQFQVTILLDDYEKESPKVKFMMGQSRLTASKMRGLITDPDELPKEKRKKKIHGRLIRTARVLVKIMEEKVKIQNDTYHNVLSLHTECYKQESEFMALYNRYQKVNKPLKKMEEIPFKDVDITKELSKYHDVIDALVHQENEEKLKTFINQLWDALLVLECDKGYLQNKYLLFKLPIDIEDYRKKKNVLERVMNKRKSLFGKREKVTDLLLQIDEDSETRKIVKMKDYIQNEIKRLEEKYSIIDEMDYATLGDYLNEFDNLGISLPMDSQEKFADKIFTREEVRTNYREIYDSLSVLEQQNLAIYHSFLQPICDVILKRLLSNEDVENDFQAYQEELSSAILILSDAENVFLRMQKFKRLSLSSPSKLWNSLVEVCKELIHMDVFKVSGTSYVFGKSLRADDFDLYHGTLKTIGLPMQKKGKFDVVDVLLIERGVSVLFLPNYYKLCDPYFHDNALEEMANREDIVVFLKKYQVKYDNSDIISVSRYTPVETMQGEYKVVKEMTLDKTEQYRHVMVTK